MINPKKLIEMARKWQKIAVIRRRRISLPRSKTVENADRYSKSVPNKGHFVVYTSDKRRFSAPLECLNNDIFRKLLRMSEEEFGLPSNGPITLPCDSIFIEYIVTLIQGCVSKDLEKELVMSIATSRCSSSSSLHQGQINQQLLLQGF